MADAQYTNLVDASIVTFDATNAYVQVTGEANQQINWFSSVTDMYVCET